MNIDLEVKIKKSKNTMDYLNIITYFRGSDEDTCQHYLNCIQENLKNPIVGKIICLTFPEKFSGEFLHTRPHPKLIVHLLDETDLENYYHLFHYANLYCQGDYCAIIRTDTVIDQNDFMTFLPAFQKKDTIYAVSSIYRMGEKMWKENEKMSNFYSLNHDIWLFKSPLDINLENFNKYSFNISENEGYVNKLLSEKYSLINDTENIKIFSIRTTEDSNLPDRLRIKNTEPVNVKEAYLLPETEILKKLTVDQLLKHFEIDELDIYRLKCRIFTKKI